MISFAETHAFTPQELELQQRATQLVSKVNGDFRCHELARAVGEYLGLEAQDGWFDMVEHTWLWTKPFKPNPLWAIKRESVPNILDVYVPGSIPQVQLINWSCYSLPWRRVYYTNPIPREDIQQDVIDQLVTQWSKS